MGPVEIGIWRMLSGAAIVGFFCWKQRGQYRLSGKDWACLLFAAVAFTAPPQIIQGYVLNQGFGHSFFGTMVAAIPLLTIVVSVPMLGIKPSPRELIGVLGGLACMWLLVEDGMHRGMSWSLLALTFVIPLSSALSNTFVKWKLRNVPAAPLTATLLVAASFALLPLQLSTPVLEAMHVAGPRGAALTPSTFAYLLLLGTVGSGLSSMVFIWMILERGPLFAGMTTYVVPVIALLWGTVDRETISSRQVLAIAGVLAMVALVQSGSRVGSPKTRQDILGDALSEALTPRPRPAQASISVSTAPDVLSVGPRVHQPESQVA